MTWISGWLKLLAWQKERSERFYFVFPGEGCKEEDILGLFLCVHDLTMFYYFLGIGLRETIQKQLINVGVHRDGSYLHAGF